MREAVLATEPSREYTTYLTIVAVAVALGQLLTLLRRPISPGQELEAIVT